MSKRIESAPYASASETVRASMRLPEDNERKFGALQQALIDGENSGDAGELDMDEIKGKARRRTGSKS